MSNVIQNQPNASTAPDFTVLISALQDMTQALLNYSQQCKANGQGQATQHLDVM